MIKLYINGELRDDVWIQAGGTLEQTEEHTTESNISVRVPIISDNLAVYDYVQIYDDDTIIFAGNILSLNQQMLDSGYTGLDFRMYDLVMACNADLVANVLVDMSFPAGSTVTHVLKGNHKGDEWYDPKLEEFFGFIETRIVPEGITIGVVENYDSTVLENTSFMWGDTCKNLLDTLAELTESFWEITNNKVFNFKRKSSFNLAPVNITSESNIFELDIEDDALSTYSAVRVVGGEGELIPSIYSYPSLYFLRIDERTLESSRKIARIGSIIVNKDGEFLPVTVSVGYSGIHDDDPKFGALISYGGNTIKLKEGYRLLTDGSLGYVIACSFIQTITARAVSQEAVEMIKQKRGGTGIIEYVLEDKTITDYNDATLNAIRFLESHKNKIQTFKFSTFEHGFEVGQSIPINISYYKLNGIFYISSVSAKFINDAHALNVLYTVECSSSLYRDIYKVLFYTPKSLSFNIGDDDGNINGFTYNVEVNIRIEIEIKKSHIPEWHGVDGKKWTDLNDITWNIFYDFRTEVNLMNVKLTEQARNLYAQFARGVMFEGTPDYAAIGRKSEGLTMTNHIILIGDNPDSELTLVRLQAATPLIGTSFSDSYFVDETMAKYLIKNIEMPINSIGGFNMFEIPVDIDKSPDNPQGDYAMTISIKIDFQ